MTYCNEVTKTPGVFLDCEAARRVRYREVSHLSRSEAVKLATLISVDESGFFIA